MTSAGRCVCSITHAIVAVLPVAVAPSSVWKRSPERSPSDSASMAPGWSPVGSNVPVKRNGGMGFQGSRARGLAASR